MQTRVLCLTLLATAIATGCQSNPRSTDVSAEGPRPAQAQQAPRQETREAAKHQVSGQVAARSHATPSAATVASAPVPAEHATLDRVQVTGSRMLQRAGSQDRYLGPGGHRAMGQVAPAPLAPPAPGYAAVDRENYATRSDNPVQRASEQPVSTFSVDVDTGSYSNVRRMLRNGQRPPADSVRAEEFLNYFSYGHPAPIDRAVPFRVTTELTPAPWNAGRQLLMVGIKGYDVPKATLPPSNLVFLLDTSGSMDSPDKLPLLKQAFSMLVPQLRAQDRVSIVVYAGSAGVVLPPTPGDRHEEILSALERLQAGGSTNGGDGIRLAYALARQGLVKDGVNRVILATDGDFNVGTTSQDALETLVGDQRAAGVALTTLGFGQGNYNDELAERLADVGDGNHAYIDTLREARKVLVDEMQSTLLTIARDVKIQVEFNPALVSEYRLIGYENRLLDREDFANDKVDAGDIGAGHEVTALYEITPVGSAATRLPALRYGTSNVAAGTASGELAHLRLRYKLPGQSASRLIETPVRPGSLVREPSESLRFASAVVAYADLLRGGTHVDGWSWEQVLQAAQGARGKDAFGLREEFVELVRQGRQVVATQATRPAIAGE